MKKLVIEEMFAFIAEDSKGEGVVGMMVGDEWMPLIAADMDRAERLKVYARNLSKEFNRKVKLVKFTNRQELEEFLPSEQT